MTDAARRLMGLAARGFVLVGLTVGAHLLTVRLVSGGDRSARPASGATGPSAGPVEGEQAPTVPAPAPPEQPPTTRTDPPRSAVAFVAGAEPIRLPRYGDFDELVMNDRRFRAVKQQALSRFRDVVSDRCRGLHFAGKSRVAVSLSLQIQNDRAQVVALGPAEVEQGSPIDDRLRACIGSAMTVPFAVSGPFEGGTWDLPDTRGETFARVQFRDDGTCGPIP